MEKTYRTEHDTLGAVKVPSDAVYGPQTARAMDNFRISFINMPLEVIYAMVEIKLAHAMAAKDLEFLSPLKADAIAWACRQVLSGSCDNEFKLPAIQGGAGTSSHMNVNEVLARLAGEMPGALNDLKSGIHPNDDVNLFQSTNDVFPTAVKMAAVRALSVLGETLASLQTAFQDKEKEFAGILKTGRTELQDALPVTLGQEFGAWAEAFARDRWRVVKCIERLRQVNLGGTAVGTGVLAPRNYLFKRMEHLRSITGLSLAASENPLDLTQNADIFAEVSGILKAAGVNLIKVSGDLRLLSSGPWTGIGEIRLPERQPGSSLMPGKVNPVIPEFAAGCGIQAVAADTAITWAASFGQLELNAFMPLIAYNLLNQIECVRAGAAALTEKCVRGITADEERCNSLLKKSGVLASLLTPYIGYDNAAQALKLSRIKGVSLEEAAAELGFFTADELKIILDPRKSTSPGIPGSDVLRDRIRFLKESGKENP